MHIFSSKPHIGLNINDRSIELARVDVDTLPKTFFASGRAELAPGAIAKGIITDADAVRRALKSVKAQAGFPEKEKIHVTLSISERLIYPLPVTLPPHAEKRHIITAIQEAARERIPLPEKRQRIFVIQETLTQQQIFAYVVDTDITEVYDHILNECGILIDYVEPDSIALSRYMLPDVALDQVVTLIDVGTDITHVITFTNGFPILSQHIPIGAETLKGNAEKYKPEHPKSSHAINAFADEVKIRVEQAAEFTRGTHDSHHVIRMVGGGSLLPHISEIVEKHLHHPVTPGHVAHSLSLHEGINAHQLPIFAHALGSALRGATKISGSSLVPLESFEPKQIRRTHSLNETKQRIGLVAGITLIAIAGLLFFTIFNNPKPPRQTTQNTNTNITLEPGQILTTKSINLDILPEGSYTFIEKELNESLQVVTSGAQTNTGQARGLVRIYNTATTERPLVADTRLESSEGVIVRIIDDVTIPPESSVDIEAVAENPGAEGNLTKGIRLTIPGLSSFNQERTYAETLEKFEGGVQTVATIAQQDIDRARETLTSIMKATFTKQLLEEESPDEVIVQFPELIAFEEALNGQQGDVADTITINLSGKAIGLKVNKEELLSQAKGLIPEAGTIIQVTPLAGTIDPVAQSGALSLSIIYSN